MNSIDEKNNNQEEKVIYFFRLLRVMTHRKIILGTVTAGVLIAGTVGLTFIDNKKTCYTSTFNYSIPSIENNKYIDGTRFNFQQLISKSNLENIKSSNEKYNSINIDYITSSKYLEIKLVKEYSETTKELINEYYVLAMPKSAFSNSKIASSFINDVISSPIAYTTEALDKFTYSTNLNNFSSSTTYEQQISYLNAQYTLLVDKYEDLISKYGDIKIDNDCFISEKKNSIIQYFQNNKLSDLSYEITQKGYVKNPSVEKSSLELEKEEKKRKIKYNTDKIDQLKDMVNYLMNNAGSTTSSLQLNSYNTAISELIIENVNLQEEIDDIDKKLSSLTNAPEEFVNTLESYKEILENDTTEYKEIEKKVVPLNSIVDYKNQQIVVIDNKPSIVKNGIISLVVGFVCACIINIIIDRKYLYKDYPSETNK